MTSDSDLASPMKARRFTRRTLPFLAAVFAAMTVAPADDARADEVPLATIEGSGVDCSVRGRGLVEHGVQLFMTATGTQSIAAFSSQEVALEVWDFPADPTSGRARARTGDGAGFRIEGFIDATKVPLTTKRDVAVVADHVWIGRGEPLKLRGASPGKLHVEATVFATQQRLRAKSPCAAVAIGHVGVDDPSPADGSHGYVLRRTSLDLFGESSGGEPVFTVEVPSPESGLLFFASETRGAMAHVTHQGAIVVDAWARLADLKPFPKGEMLDALSPSSMVTVAPAKLKVDGAIRELKAPKETPLKLAASDTAKPIGVIEAGADVIVIDTIAGWARVFPKGLEVVPPEGKDFWAKASDLGL